VRSSVVDLSLLGSARTAYGNPALKARPASPAEREKKTEKVSGFEESLKEGLTSTPDARSAGRRR